MAPKLFVIKKYVMAHSAKDAINKEKKVPVDDVWIDQDWRENNLSTAMGFKQK